MKKTYKGKLLIGIATGSLIYFAGTTRSDILFAVGYATRFTKALTVGHWKLVKQILGYLRGSIHQTSVLHMSDMENGIYGYSDADFTMSGDRKSATGSVSLSE